MNIELDAMIPAAEAASGLLKAMANRHRLLLLCQLVDGERSVGQLAGFLNLRDSNVSQHLGLLRRDGLVTTRRDGQTIYYAIGSDAARAVIETLYRALCRPAPLCEPDPAEPDERSAST